MHSIVQNRGRGEAVLECAALTALWSAATCRSFALVECDVKEARRQAAADQSVVEPPHSKGGASFQSLRT
jgi:hypothetical protein